MLFINILIIYCTEESANSKSNSNKNISNYLNPNKWFHSLRRIMPKNTAIHKRSHSFSDYKDYNSEYDQASSSNVDDATEETNEENKFKPSQNMNKCMKRRLLQAEETYLATKKSKPSDNTTAHSSQSIKDDIVNYVRKKLNK